MLKPVDPIRSHQPTPLLPGFQHKPPIRCLSLEVNPTTQYRQAVAHIQVHQLLLVGGHVIEHLRVGGHYPAGAVSVHIGPGYGYAQVVAVGEEVVGAQRGGFGVAIKGAGHVSATVTVASFVNAMFVDDVGYGRAEQVIGGGVGVFQVPLLLALAEAGGPVAAQ